MTFKVGDRVRIRRDSQYAYQSNVIGLITSITDTWFKVVFIDGDNSYHASDLESVHNTLKSLIEG